MSKEFILALLLGYFVVLIIISYFTSRKADNETFFTGNRNNKWYLVAFGMIGASLSGVTFISIPGTIANSQFTYMQMATGYIIGYAIISFVLMPIYYKLNLTSIYSYLNTRFGKITYKMGAGFFILSRLIGAALRMYLVVNVLQTFVFDNMGISFEFTVAFSILLIWVYTFRAGIKTIIWTDTLQTLFMLISVGLSIYFIADDLNQTIGQLIERMNEAGVSQIWQTSDPNKSNYWIKGILAGMFITLGMTGVDQDMMQKNLSCKDLGEAKKNMISFSIVLFFVNILFVFLGGLLFMELEANPEVATAWANVGSDNDLLFATIALKGSLGLGVGIFFLLGLIAAAYSSADSALTSLATSLSVDFLNIEKQEKKKQEKIRRMAHVIMSIALLLTILIFKYVKSDAVVWELFKAAQYTYGPLLGLFMFGILTKRSVRDLLTVPICILVPIFIFMLNYNSALIFGDFEFGSELLGVNAGLVFLLLWVISKKKTTTI